MLTTYLFSQGWNTYVPTTISEPNLVKMDLFTNKDGNHLLIQNSNSTNSIKYYLLNSSGTVLRSSTIETSGYAEFPNISGDNDNVYLIYKLGNYLKAKKSTDAGQNWNSVNIQPISVGSNACNGLDIVYDYQGLHVVYAMRDNNPYFETYYYRLNSTNAWVDYKNVTDYNVNEVGGVPSVTVSNNRVHVSYNTGEATPPYIGVGVSKSRDKNGTTWEAPQLVSVGEEYSGTSREKLQVRGTDLYCFFFDFWIGGGQYGNYIQVKSRSLSTSTWPTNYLRIFNYGAQLVLMGAESTSDGNLNIAHYDFFGIKHKYFDGSSWSDQFAVTTDAINYESKKFYRLQQALNRILVWFGLV